MGLERPSIKLQNLTALLKSQVRFQTYTSVSAMSSVSADPPMLLVRVNQELLLPEVVTG